MLERGLACSLVLATVVGCGGAQTPPPCVETTWLIPEEDVLQRVRYTYDDEGRVVLTETLVGDREDLVERAEVTYDDDGRVASEVINGRDEEGRPLEVVLHYTYDDDDRLMAVDSIVGTEVGRGETYTYDEEGRISEVTFYAPGSEGSVERVMRYTYGEDDRSETVETDLLGDGTVESRVTTTFDDDGNPLVIETSGDDQALSVRTTFSYDDDGRPRLEAADSGADGTIETERRYVYGAVEDGGDEVLLSEEIDEGNDGSVDRRIAYVYDEEGRLLSETDLISDDGADPTASRRVTSSRTEYDYSCWDRQE